MEGDGGQTAITPPAAGGGVWGWSSLVFLSQQDGEHAPRFLRIARVRRAVLERAVVAINFPEQLDAVEVEGTEVVLPVGVISGVKSEKSRTAARARAMKSQPCAATPRVMTSSRLASSAFVAMLPASRLRAASFKSRIRSVVADSSVMMGK